MVPERQSAVSRRAALAGAGVTLVGSAGCLQRLRATEEEPSDQLVVRITIPAGDYDPFAAPIAQHLISGFEAAGIEYRLTPVPQEELYREVLLAADFDIYIGRFPYDRAPDPDVLYPLLHSRFHSEIGWQNPFGFSNVACDELLDAQRRQNADRQETVAELQMLLGETQPFVPLVRPDIIAGVRRDRFDGWEQALANPLLGLLQLEQTAEDGHLSVGSTDPRVTENRNPISTTHSHDTSIVNLLYDSLTVVSDGEHIEWLASEIDWESSNDEESIQALVTLRDDLRWHDGEALTASDVAFTYAFLEDTSRGDAPNPVPTPRFRQQSTLVTSATALDEQTVRLTFGDATQSVAKHALTAPIFPEHIWAEQTETASIGGIELSESITDALVWDNPEPVGSGPIQFEEATAGSSVAVSRFADHFLQRSDEDSEFTAPAFDSLTVELLSSSPALVEALSAAAISASISPVAPTEVEQIEAASAVSLVTARSYASYHLGFNTRSEPFSDPNFRRTVGRLCDKATLTTEVFGGYGEPIASPLAATEWVAEELQWDGTDPMVPFLGTAGEVDAARAKDAFREIGYQYNASEELVV